MSEKPENLENDTVAEIAPTQAGSVAEKNTVVASPSSDTKTSDTKAGYAKASDSKALDDKGGLVGKRDIESKAKTTESPRVATPARPRVESDISSQTSESTRGPEMGDGEEDDETWTNQPSGAAPAAAESDDSIDDIEEDEDETPVVTRKVIQNARDVICEELPARAQRAKLRLHPQLTGAFVIEVTTTGEKFLFDWRGEEPKVGPLSGEPELSSPETIDLTKVDCIISISEPNLMAVRSGDLNPQVAMLADKIKVKGRMGPAVYLFNLVAPRMRE